MKEITANIFSLIDKFKLINSYWEPKIVGELNGQFIKLAKFKGEFIWHQHDNEDELFFVIKGELKIKLEDRELMLREGDLAIIPRCTQHLPIAEDEVHVLLFEPKSTINTGEVTNEFTVEGKWI